MDDPARSERRYRDDEVSAILARAAAKETRTDLPAPHDATLSDLMAAAAEAGLDPAEVRRAAAVDVRARFTFVDLALGGPDRREVSARLEGARIPADSRAVVRRAEEALGGKGEVVESAPGRFEWRSEGVGARGHLTLTEREGALELAATVDRAGHYVGLLFVGLVAWAALSVLTPLGALPALGKLVSLIVVPPLVARPFWTAADRRARERLEALALDVLRAGEEGGPAALPEGEGGGA